MKLLSKLIFTYNNWNLMRNRFKKVSFLMNPNFILIEIRAQRIINSTTKKMSMFSRHCGKDLVKNVVNS